MRDCGQSDSYGMQYQQMTGVHFNGKAKAVRVWRVWLREVVEVVVRND